MTTTEMLPGAIPDPPAWPGTTPDPIAAAAAEAERRREAARELAEFRRVDAQATRTSIAIGTMTRHGQHAGLDVRTIRGRYTKRVALVGATGVNHRRKFVRVVGYLDAWMPEALTAEITRSIDRNISADMWDRWSARKIAVEALTPLFFRMSARGDATGRAMAHPKSTR